MRLSKLILGTTLKFICPLLAIYSAYILLRGHNEPGGGFIGGLLLALAAILWMMRGQKPARSEAIVKLFPVILGVLVLFLLGVVLFPALFGFPVLQGMWSDFWIPIAQKFSSVLLFDVAIYLIVSICSIFSYTVLSGRIEERA